MKICPTCRKTYTDETLNYCLEDGAVLNQYNANESSEPTIFMGQPPTTSTNPSMPNPTVGNPANQTLPQYNQIPSQNLSQYNQTASQTVSRPAKKSKAWIWVLGIICAIVVLGGIGFIGIVALIASNIEETDNTSGNKIVEKKETPINFKNVIKENFSTWRTDSNSYGSTEYRGGEYIMSSKQVNYYYVLVASDVTHKTINASTKVTVRSVNGTATNSGYGLLIHSEMKNPLVKDYGFLIDSAKQSYRIVQHTNLKENTLVNWTRFPAIRSGTQSNEIEVRDQDGKISFYINGQFANSIDDKVNYRDGVFGLYVSDAIPIAFSNLQIGK